MQKNKKASIDKEFVYGHVMPCLRKPGTGNEDHYTEKYIDMELYYRVFCGESNDQAVSFVVTKAIMIGMGILPEDLRRVAEANARENAKIETMDNFLSAATEGGCERPEDAVPLYIVSNPEKWFGAGLVVCSDVLDRLVTETGSSTLLVIPSSVHEMLAMPATEKSMTVERLNKIIRLVNDLALSESDYLSDHCYVYNSQTKNLFYKAQ